jgi:3-deoxy-D-manno-octulosonic-acid transferase
MREIYSIIMALLQPLLKFKLHRRGQQEPGYLANMSERWGDYSQLQEEGHAPSHVWNESSLAYRPTVWIHAVSLGETRAAAVLLRELRSALPDMRLLLTHGTATGRAEGKSLIQEGDRQVWLPWDTPTAVDRFLRRFQPEMGILIETEVWPNLVAACRQSRVPLILVNARLSEKSLKKARRLAWLARPAYRALTAVYAQTHADAGRLTQLGARVADVLGNLKFDARPSRKLVQLGQSWRKSWQAKLPQPKGVVIFASSREGEEALFIQLLADMQPEQRQAVQWLIVPRHPQRFDEVAALIESAGLTLLRRSQWDAPADTKGPAGVTADVWLGDSLGEMAAYYAMADLALLGGSFLPLGGQNLIEAAACGCPVIMGPHTFNFAEAATNSAQAGAAFEVADLAEGVTTAIEMLQKPELMNQCRFAASAFLKQHQGATSKTVTAIVAMVR